MPRRRSPRPPNQAARRLIILLFVLLVGYFLYREFQRSAVDIQIQVPDTSGNNPTAQPAPAQGGASADWYQLFFSTPKYPDKKEYHHGGIDEQLVAFINTATKTIDLADYDFHLENVANALAQAAIRGVRVRMVTDTDTLTNDDPKLQKAFGILKQANIPIVDDQ